MSATISIKECYLEMFGKYDDIVTVDEIAKMLHTDKKRAYRMIRSGEIKSIRLGRAVRVPKLWVIEYIQEYGAKQEESIHDQRRKMLMEFCQEPKSCKQIQEHLDLSDRFYFRHTVMTPMIETGDLLLTIPENPSHIKQRYVTRAVESYE